MGEIPEAKKMATYTELDKLKRLVYAINVIEGRAKK
jgi:hypothetical protein